ncbi:putative SnoaL-like aldol condensation-catalyzing enzyme [Saonia flava]|uniref:Putative SnoaL-like aldol condensation-catalyzing enzyme n=1 Tax=Saonia flava TaxID=523696 RepID=A0A846QUN2_9FLAO|nr:nuclear transport factor 2 family protein [Saonia flava]NJB71738.1 putative SnoaL-like aldol condensation-catalyzing enzyme [Saonia flava]
MTKKEIAILFLKLVGGGEVKQAFTKFVASDFIHHNQYFKGNGEALAKAMEEAHYTSPNKSIDIKYSYTDGDTVITHSHVIKHDMEIAVVHIFKFQNEKIIELWDLGQIIEKGSPNENGLF